MSALVSAQSVAFKFLKLKETISKLQESFLYIPGLYFYISSYRHNIYHIVSNTVMNTSKYIQPLLIRVRLEKLKYLRVNI